VKEASMSTPETAPNGPDPSFSDRYSRQIRFSPIGRAGQERLVNSQITIVGCGALGSVLAETLARGGVGRIHLVDRDFIELSNLQRQMLFDEDDIAANLPKAEAAARKLSRINSQIEIVPFIADANHESIEIFTEGSDLILDGTDNLLARYLINDVAIKHNIPWIYGACQGTTAMTATFLAGGKPCLRCLFDTPPDPGQLETCETAGIIGPVVNIIAGFQAAEALKILTGNIEAVNRSLMTIEAWSNHIHQMSLAELTEGCLCCRDHQFDFLSGKSALSTVALCGRNAVQIRPKIKGKRFDLNQIASRLEGVGQLEKSDFMLRFTIDDFQLTIFPDARTIIKGTEEKDIARAVYAKYIGH
jgi:molybdopterin/thiamine biosynthesis adenylyltransferase